MVVVVVVVDDNAGLVVVIPTIEKVSTFGVGRFSKPSDTSLNLSVLITSDILDEGKGQFTLSSHLIHRTSFASQCSLTSLLPKKRTKFRYLAKYDNMNSKPEMRSEIAMHSSTCPQMRRRISNAGSQLDRRRCSAWTFVRFILSSVGNQSGAMFFTYKMSIVMSETRCESVTTP